MTSLQPSAPAHLPVESTRVQTLKGAQEKQSDWNRTLAWTAAVMALPPAVLAGRAMATGRRFGRPGIESLREAFGPVLDPYITAAYVAATVAVGFGIHAFRHRNDYEFITLPPFPPEPDLRRSYDVVLGSAWTWDGFGPGDEVHRDAEVFDDPHLRLTEMGAYGNVHIIGATGSGKGESAIKPLLFSWLTKFPKPEVPPQVLAAEAEAQGVAADETALARQQAAEDRAEAAFAQEFDFLRTRPGLRWSFGDGGGLRQRWYHDLLASAAAIAARLPAVGAAAGAAVGRLARAAGAHADDEPYAGLSLEAARAKYEERLREHHEKKVGLLMLDPKGNLADFLLRVATLTGRQDDVIILRPGSRWTYNALLLNERPLTMAEFIMDGVRAVAEGGLGADYWRQVMSEWLTNAIHILRAVAPTKLTFNDLLNMARDEQLRARYVGQAIRIRQEQEREEARLASLGLAYTGVSVDKGAIEFFKDFDSDESDPKQRREVISGLKAYFKFFVESDIRTMLNPELHPTFRSFADVFQSGKLVCLHLPFDEYGPVGRVLGILMLMDFQQVARARVNRPGMNRDRMVALLVDECTNYLNVETVRFVSLNRESRVTCVFAHQSISQLPPMYERAFNDNLRTKIIFTAPHAVAAGEVSKLLGMRRGVQRTLSESLSSRAAEDAKDTIAESMSYREADEPWFRASEIDGLVNGECIVKAFDGERNLTPRKVKAELFWRSPLAERVRPLEHVKEVSVAPHPVLRVQGGAQDFEYLRTLVEMNRFFLLHPLFTADGAFGGVRVTAATGTALVPYEHLSEAQAILEEAAGQEFAKLVFPSAAEGLVLGWYLLGLRPAHPVFVDQLLADLGRPEVDLWAYLAAEHGTARWWKPVGGWEQHMGEADGVTAAIGRESRAIVTAYTALLQAVERTDAGRFVWATSPQDIFKRHLQCTHGKSASA